MYDSWPSFPPKALLEGTVTEFGDYDQCLAIKPNPIINGPKYCVISLRIPLPKPTTLHINLNHKVDNILPQELINGNRSENFFNKLAENAVYFYLISMRLGLCFPEKCDSNDVHVLVQRAFENSSLILENIDCNTKTTTHLNAMQMIALVVLALFLIVSLFATIFNKSHFNKFPKYKRLLKAFSLKENAMKIMSTDNKPELRCLDGIRVLTMVYILVAHVIEYTDWSLYKDTFRIKDAMNEWQNIPLSKVHTVVETFFLLSGLLASYTTLKRTKAKLENFDRQSYVCQRVIRLLPLMAVFILLTTLVPLTNSGPVWNRFMSERIDTCYTNWWHNLLFIHNFIDSKHMCIGTTWFLSVDMQFHLLSFVVILAILKKPRFGLIVNFVLILVSILIVSTLIFVMDFTPGRVSTQFGSYFMNEWLQYVYWQPWPHASVYFIGLAFGYYLYKMRLVKLTQSQKWLLWSAISVGYVISIYDTYYWTFGAPNNRLIAVFLYPSTRVVWALSTCAVIWMCLSGNGDLVNRFLSWSAFTPLSRLTYCVYLTHIWIVWSFWASRRQLPDNFPSSVWAMVCYTVFFSYLIGFAFAVLFESPIAYFQSVLKKVLVLKPKETQIYREENGRCDKIEDNIDME